MLKLIPKLANLLSAAICNVVLLVDNIGIWLKLLSRYCIPPKLSCSYIINQENFFGRYTNSRQFVGEGVIQLMTIVGSMQLCDDICSNPVLYSRIDSWNFNLIQWGSDIIVISLTSFGLLISFGLFDIFWTSWHLLDFLTSFGLFDIFWTSWHLLDFLTSFRLLDIWHLT